MKCNKRNEPQRNRVLKEFARRIDYLKKKGKVDVDEFYGFERKGDDEEETNYYDREIVRGEYETTMDLPYARVELYSEPTFGYKDSQIKYPGLLREDI